MCLNLKPQCQWSMWARYVISVHTGVQDSSYFVLLKLSLYVQLFGFVLYVTEYKAKRGGRILFIPKVLFEFFH